MRSLRQTISTLGPAIILVSVLCEIISAQSGLTTIQDTLFDADGSRYYGSLFIQWSTFDTTNPGTIIQQSKTVQVVNGNLLVQLASNNTATPPANIYTVLYQSDGDQQYTETWSVPSSTAPLKVSQVRTGTGGSGSAGGLTGSTGPIAEASVTNLVSDLNARPVKGPGYGINAVAVVNQNGQLETAVGNLGDCLFVDGTTGPCSAPVTLPVWVNGETPGGVINGINGTFTLADTPSGSSLLLFRNGVLVQAGLDYSLSGSTIQFAGNAMPQPSDTLVAEYRLDGGSGSSGASAATGPSGAPGVNGCGAAGTASKSATYQMQTSDNGLLLFQTAAADLALPVTVPAAGWCVALLDTNAAAVAVMNNGNAINGLTAAYNLQPGAAIFAISDGTGYWISGASGTAGSGGTGATGPPGPAGTAGAIGPAGATGATGTPGTAASLGPNSEFNTSQTMTSADCPSALKTFTGTSALSYTLLAPVAGCNVGVQNNTTQALTINASANGVTVNGQNADVTIPACPAQPSGCPAAVIRSNGTTSWDMSLPASTVSSGGGSAGITRQVVFGPGGGSAVVTHNLDTTTPLIGMTFANSGCGTCYSIGSFTANTFTVTSNQAADLIFTLAYAAPPPTSFSLTVAPVVANEFQSGSMASYTVTQTVTGSYSGTVTLSCAGVTASGVTCAFSPATITNAGTSTLTVTASPTAAVGAGTLIVSGTDGTVTRFSAATSLTIWPGPVQQWYMNEGSSPMLDTSGNPDNLTNSNVTFTSIAGLLPNTVTYDGSSSGTVAANQTNTSFTGTSPFTVCGWLSETAGYTGQSDIVSTLNASGTGWLVYLNGGSPNNNALSIWLQGSGSGLTAVFGNMEPATAAVYQWCVATDGTGSANGITFWTNGANSGQQYQWFNGFSGSAANLQDVSIGYTASTASHYFHGGIADVRIYGYVLSNAQVAAINAAGVK